MFAVNGHNNVSGRSKPGKAIISYNSILFFSVSPHIATNTEDEWQWYPEAYKVEESCCDECKGDQCCPARRAVPGQFPGDDQQHEDLREGLECDNRRLSPDTGQQAAVRGQFPAQVPVRGAPEEASEPMAG